MRLIKQIAIPIAVAVVIFAIIFTIDFEEPVTLDEMPQNVYSITPVTTPIKVTTQTIEPSSIQVDAQTQNAPKTVRDNNNYPGAGFVFPFLQKSFGIDASTTTLNVEDWDIGENNGGRSDVWKDETGGSFAGNIYFSAVSTTVFEIYSLNPTTDILTTWTTPGDGFTWLVDGNSAGEVFYFKGTFGSSNTDSIQRLDPSTDQITVWDLPVPTSFKPNGIEIDQTTGIVYISVEQPTSQFLSLNPATNELKIWSVNSICPKGSSAFNGIAIDSAGGTTKIYTNQLQQTQVCVLDPATNQVTLYDSGIGRAGSDWSSHLDLDPTNPGHVFFIIDSGVVNSGKIYRVDTVSDETTVWTLTGINRSQFIKVDANGLVWSPTIQNSAYSLEQGLLMLNPATNSVTEWSFGYGGQAEIFPAVNGDIWMHTENTASGTNDHILRFYQ